MAVPYELIVAIAAIIVVALAIGWWRAPLLVPAGSGPGPVRRRRMAAGAVLAGLMVLAGALDVAGMPLLPNAQPLRVGGAAGGDDPRLLGFRTGFAADGRIGEALYAYAPRAELRTGLQLANSGPAELIVTGLEPSGGPQVRSLALRLAPGDPQQSAILLPLYPAEGSTPWMSEPFHPFRIPAHGEVAVALAATLGTCAGAQPQPTRAPGATLWPEGAPVADGGFGAVDTLRLDYTVLGVQRTAVLPLPLAITVVTGGNTFGCPKP